MHVVIVAFDGFTDIDLFMPWDLFNRVQDPVYAAYTGSWRVSICADAPQVSSYSGLRIDVHGPLSWARDSDAVFFVSGPGSRKKLADAPFLNELRLDPSRQMIAGIDSGVLLLAKLGLLEGLSATTYPSVFPELEAMGIRAEHRAMVVHGNIATGGGCPATQDLAGWIVERLVGHAAARAVSDDASHRFRAHRHSLQQCGLGAGHGEGAGSSH
jgi:transcriptional regulator GlxA family with amidase domain